jgi:flagellar hook assembly protein FlgD
VLTGIATGHSTPVAFSLDQNYPNPFNPVTTIRFAVPIRTHVKLAVYNTLGQRVALLVNEAKSEGIHTIQWNGKSDHGFSVASGMYFYQITAGNFTSVRKMLLIK